MDYGTLVSVNHSLLLKSDSFKANLILISNCISHFQRDVLFPLARHPSEPGGFLAVLQASHRTLAFSPSSVKLLASLLGPVQLFSAWFLGL